MRFKQANDTGIEAVKVPNNEYNDHPSGNWPETPAWLQEAFDNRTIRPNFGGEDYWYYDIHGGGRVFHAGPDDWVVRDPSGYVYGVKDSVIKEQYIPVNPTGNVVPVFLPGQHTSTVVGSASVDANGTITVDVDDDRIKAYLGESINNHRLSLSFIENA